MIILTNKQKITVLNKAADLIEKHGTTKYTRKDLSSGAMCIHGAIAEAFNFEYPEFDRFGRINLSIEEQLCEPINAYFAAVNKDVPRTDFNSWALASWNNLDSTTKEDVVDALRNGAKWLKSKPVERLGV